MGRLLSQLPSVAYWYEPYHYWRAIDQRTDVTGLHGSYAGTRFFLDASDWTAEAQRRFDNVFGGSVGGGRTRVEKLPHNVARIGWLQSLCPKARYIHLVRDGVEVAQSIDRVAATSPYRMAFKPRYVPWWGTDSHRWTALRAEASARGYCADEVDRLTTDVQRGAYEWFVCVSEGQRWQRALGERWLDVRYDDLVEHPETVLARIIGHLGVEAPPRWLADAARLCRRQSHRRNETLVLPRRMAEPFQQLQDAYGFAGVAKTCE
jgi:hypothetical protein